MHCFFNSAFVYKLLLSLNSYSKVGNTSSLVYIVDLETKANND